jgi:hypothetical protein
MERCAGKRLTRIRRENPAFNYGFFRPNPLAFEREAGKNAGHAADFTGLGSPEQAKIARSGPGRYGKWWLARELDYECAGD